MYKFIIPSGGLHRTSRLLLGQAKTTKSEITIRSEALCKSEMWFQAIHPLWYRGEQSRNGNGDCKPISSIWHINSVFILVWIRKCYYSQYTFCTTVFFNNCFLFLICLVFYVLWNNPTSNCQSFKIPLKTFRKTVNFIAMKILLLGWLDTPEKFLPVHCSEGKARLPAGWGPVREEGWAWEWGSQHLVSRPNFP